MMCYAVYREIVRYITENYGTHIAFMASSCFIRGTCREGSLPRLLPIRAGNNPFRLTLYSLEFRVVEMLSGWGQGICVGIKVTCYINTYNIHSFSQSIHFITSLFIHALHT